ncbi:MAG: RdgB/HAM1 family non-canonical purine NTP pyrophosphatase [Actinomycetota bacterium]|nr:RdgB/HAM1 family non-canonical purine NTP pyrophosphatase [Actinomycetota bacterium]
MTARQLRLVCASANPDKVAEIEQLLTGIAEMEPRPTSLGEVIEDADSLTGNARLKAVAVCDASGHAAIADDTGLEVDALGGAPGIYAARFAGENATYADNRRKLLDDMSGVEKHLRTARFRTVVMVMWPNGDEIVVEGVCEGRIAEAEMGDAGFGYDSIFIPDDGDGRSFAQMSADEKNVMSHRARAFSALPGALMLHSSTEG